MCRDCGQRPGRARHLCSSCYDRHRHAGTLIDWERRTWPRDLLVAEARALRAAGLSWERVAARLGVQAESVRRAIRRWEAA